MENLISIYLEATKIKEEKFVDEFIANTRFDFCNLNKIHKKSGYGCSLETKFATINEINVSEEFRFILNNMIENGFKAHDAKNNYMKITYKIDEPNSSLLKKIDLFILQNEAFCRNFARKKKVFHFLFDEKSFYNLAVNDVNKRPLTFDGRNITFNFFRSTLKFETIMASVEFVKFLFDFIKDTRVGVTYDVLFEQPLLTLNTYIRFAKDRSVYFNHYLKQQFGDLYSEL